MPVPQGTHKELNMYEVVVIESGQEVSRTQWEAESPAVAEYREQVNRLMEGEGTAQVHFFFNASTGVHFLAHHYQEL